MGSYHLDKPITLLLSVLLFPLKSLENQTLTIPGIGLNGPYSFFFLDKTSTSMSKLIFLILDPYLFQLLPYPSLHIKQPSKLRFDQEGPPFGCQLPDLIFFSHTIMSNSAISTSGCLHLTPTQDPLQN